jgi:hypothetical protein
MQTKYLQKYFGPVFGNVDFPDLLVSHCDTRFTSAIWTALHAALGSSLIFQVGSPHQTVTSDTTTSVVMRLLARWSASIASLPASCGPGRAFSGNSADDWPEVAPLAKFALNDSVSPLRSDYIPLYADYGQQTQHPRRPRRTRPRCPRRLPAGSCEALTHMMARVMAEVLALLQELQVQRKVALDAHLRDVQFTTVGEVSLTQNTRPATRGRC